MNTFSNFDCRVWIKESEIRRIFLLCVMFFALCLPLEAQQPDKKLHRIGMLLGGSPYVEAFREGLSELGYVEGKNVIMSIDIQRENTISTMSFLQSLCA